MPIGKYTSTSPKPAELEAPTNAVVETPKPPEEPVVAKKAAGPITPRQAVVGAVTEDLDRKVAEGAGLEQRQRTYAEVLAAEGIPPQRSRELTLATLAALEGAFVLSRAARTTEAMDAAGAMAGTLPLWSGSTRGAAGGTLLALTATWRPSATWRRCSCSASTLPT